ncbi:PREDICTED: proton-coupled folate transporter-like [Ceratosolen solmsi marchali]|uniref:Proton-coupled folate transporter-like n=1 Tax=Ceratosolen solmsi marchali TaxID=326594 RepID=A0AAJ6YDI5_9HYME|nr:PREDICTED: proton-coupled folate transporter-like [Ceratosolen solmsi marchali]
MEAPIPGWRRFTYMEPLAFALFFAFSVSDNVMTDFIVYRMCKSMSSLNNSECDILHENSSSKEAIIVEKLVQPHTGLILVLKSCIETIFPTIMSLFLGPWSDKNGRKPLLIFPFTGLILYYATITCLSSIDVNIYWLLLSSIPFSLLGGFPAILLTFFCYTTDISNNQNRAWHLACLDTTMFAGLLAGLFVGPMVFKQYGYIAVFSLSTLLCFLALLYSILFVKETIENDNMRTLRSVFDISLVKELFCAVTKQRNGFDRYLVWSCISAIALHIVIIEGNSSISFLFASSKLGWNITDFSIYSGTHILISIVGMLFLIKFIGSFLRLPDTFIIVLSCLSNSAACLTKGFVYKSWQMYFSSGIGMFSSTAIPMIRAIISKSVPPNDVGKTFSLTTTMEMIVPFASTPLYIFIYTRTLSQYPCPVWFLSAVLPIVIIMLAIIIEHRWRKLKNTEYTPFMNNFN